MSNIKFNKKVKFNNLDFSNSKKIGVFDENNFLSYINKRDLDNILVFESIFEANQYINNHQIETGTLGFVKEDGKYYYFDSNSFSWKDLFGTINLDSFINKTSSNIVTSDFKLTDTSSSVTFSILNNYVNINGKLNVSDNNGNTIFIDTIFGIKSNKDFTEVEKDNNLLFAQRKYVDDKINSISTSIPSLQKVLEKGNESVSGSYKVKLEPILFSMSKTNSVIFSEVYYNKIGLNTTSNESKVEIGIKDNILPYQYFKLNDNFIYLYPNNSPVESDISIYYPQKSGTLALLDDIPAVDNYLEKNKLNEVTNDFGIVRKFGIPNNNPESFILENYINSEGIPEVGIGINDDNSEGVRLLFNRDKIKVRSQDGDDDSMTFDGMKISFDQYLPDKSPNDVAQMKDITLEQAYINNNIIDYNKKKLGIRFIENVPNTDIGEVKYESLQQPRGTTWSQVSVSSPNLNSISTSISSTGVTIGKFGTNDYTNPISNSFRYVGLTKDGLSFTATNGKILYVVPEDFANIPQGQIVQKLPAKSGTVALNSDIESLKQWVIDNFLSKQGGEVNGDIVANKFSEK